MRRSRSKPQADDVRAGEPGPDEGARAAALRARVDLEDRFRRAVKGAEGSAEVLALLEQALVERFGDAIRLLVPDPAQVRLGPANLIDPDQTTIDADGCLAFRRGEPVVTESSRQFDACPHLRDLQPPVSGVCVPVAATGSALGVAQWIGPERAPLDPAAVATIESVAHLGACHVLLRRSGDSEAPRIDPLTGLLNPYSLNKAILDLVTDLVPFSIGVCTIDDFDEYNNANGHGTGDEALRLFTRCLQDTVRPGDVVARTDLDQFTVVFPSTSALDAAHALERVRERLVLARADSGLASFNASFGVADSNQGSSIEAIVDTAELARQLAHSAGSNRVVVAGEETPGEGL